MGGFKEFNNHDSNTEVRRILDLFKNMQVKLNSGDTVKAKDLENIYNPVKLTK